jgi:hypothetical protein
VRYAAFAVVVCAAGLTGARAASPPAPLAPLIVVELFTSEGCSSCPPADALLQTLVDTRPNVIGLGLHVDYWDELGWKDRFSSAALTNRQRVYATRLGTESIYTPQMIVDGHAEFVGSDAAAARRAIDRAVQAPHGVVRVTVEETNIGPGSTKSQGRDRGAVNPALHITVAASDLPKSGKSDRADIVVVIAEDHLHTDVTRGENHGRTLAHTAVVRQLVAVGEASEDGASSVATDIALAPGWQRDHLKVVAFVQERRSRTIVAAAVVPLAGR